MAFSELETLLHLNELGHKQKLQSLALAVLKKPKKGYCLSGYRPNYIDNEGNIHILWYYNCTKKSHHSLYLTKDATKEHL